MALNSDGKRVYSWRGYDGKHAEWCGMSDETKAALKTAVVALLVFCGESLAMWVMIYAMMKLGKGGAE